MRILVLEASTSSAKAMLFDEKSGVVGMLCEPYSPAAQDPDGSGTQDPELVFRHTAAVGNRLAQGQSVDAIVPCATWHNVMVADRHGEALTPTYTWAYSGASAVAGSLRSDADFCNTFYQRTGCMVHAIYPVFKILNLIKSGLDLSDKSICSQGSYNVYRLTGAQVTTDVTASGSGFLNVHTREWDSYAMKLAGLKQSQFFRLTNYRESFPLSAEGARLLGLRAGIPVLPSYPDGALNQVGAGALAPGVMTFSVGTSGALRLSSQQPVLPAKPSTWCYLSPNAWLSGAATSGACNCLDWCKSLFFPRGTSYADLEQAHVSVEQMPLFFPFLFGERCPGWNDEWTGGFLKLLPEHNAADLYRSVQEGVLFNLYQCYQMLCAENGVPSQIQLSGGITHSRVWMQMCCDIFGRSLDCSDTLHASMLGGAVLALEHLGVLSRIEDFRAVTTEALTPDPAMHALYEKRFQRYLELYEKHIC